MQTIDSTAAMIDFEYRKTRRDLARALAAPVGKGMAQVRQQRIARLQEQLRALLQEAMDAGIDVEARGYKSRAPD
ncbi:hypothetical protein [Microbacterium sp.]|uniref:hypothetical protein n=1 Tax=Microbacterium sp. TaxID=51671 RepID=UPI002603459E|nr:hypothetical protein [Microbacterium sp.]